MTEASWATTVEEQLAADLADAQAENARLRAELERMRRKVDAADRLMLDLLPHLSEYAEILADLEREG
jgi:hypothetical protein